jgi:hypothetical protein
MSMTVVGYGILPDGLRSNDHRIHLRGNTGNLEAFYRTSRLAVATLPSQAGLNEAVLDAWTAGLPCVMNPIAAEGLSLPSGLQPDVAASPAGFAARILTLHSYAKVNRSQVRYGRALLRRHFSQAAVTAALRVAVKADKTMQRPAARSA